MKKIIALFISTLLILSSIGCADTTTEEVNTSLLDKYSQYELTYGNEALFEETLIPVLNQNELWGYMNVSGEMVIEAQFDYADKFESNGIAKVYKDQKVYMINFSGDTIISTGYDALYFYDNCVLGQNTWPGLSDEYDIYDYEGNLLKDDAESFDEVEALYPNDLNPGLQIELGNSEYEIYNEDGVLLTSDAFDYIMPTRDANIRIFQKDDLYGFVTGITDTVITPAYKNRIEFGTYLMMSDISAIITEGDLLGFVDTSGEIIIEPQFDVSTYEYLDEYEVFFRDGVQLVPDGESEKIIDLEGNVLYEAPDDGSMISEYDGDVIELIYEHDSDVTLMESKVVDYDNNVLYEGTYVSVYLTKDDSDVFFVLEPVRIPQPGITGADVTMYDYQGTILKDNISMVYASWVAFKEHITFVNGLMDYIDNETETIGFMDQTGTTIIEPQFGVFDKDYKLLRSTMFHSDGYAVVMKNGYYGVIDTEGNVIIPFEYLEITGNLVY